MVYKYRELRGRIFAEIKQGNYSNLKVINQDEYYFLITSQNDYYVRGMLFLGEDTEVLKADTCLPVKKTKLGKFIMCHHIKFNVENQTDIRHFSVEEIEHEIRRLSRMKAMFVKMIEEDNVNNCKRNVEEIELFMNHLQLYIKYIQENSVLQEQVVNVDEAS